MFEFIKQEEKLTSFNMSTMVMVAPRLDQITRVEDGVPFEISENGP